MNQHPKRRDVLGLIHAVRSKGADGVFDEVVRQSKADEAREINSRGLKRQIEYLCEAVGLDALQKMLGRLVEHRQEMLEIAASAKAVTLVQAVYAEKQAEADALASRDPIDQVRYLADRVQGMDRLRHRLWAAGIPA